MTSKDFDPVENPKHYNPHPSGVECIEITRHHDFAIGNVIKYVWRAGLKNDGQGVEAEIEDLKKARYYLDDKIKMLEAQPDETRDRIAREIADDIWDRITVGQVSWDQIVTVKGTEEAE